MKQTKLIDTIRKLENEISQAQEEFNSVKRFEKSENRNERQAYLLTKLKVASLKNDLVNAKTLLLLETGSLESLNSKIESAESEYNPQPE